MKRDDYKSPQIEVFEIMIEKGFAQSRGIDEWDIDNW